MVKSSKSLNAGPINYKHNTNETFKRMKLRDVVLAFIDIAFKASCSGRTNLVYVCVGFFLVVLTT